MLKSFLMATHKELSDRTAYEKLLPTLASEQGKVVSVGVHIYVWTKKILNPTLAIDSPFQTFAAGVLIKFID